MPWWTSEPVLTGLRKHQRYSIVNLANELGNYRWTDRPASALVSFKNAYQTAISRIRAHYGFEKVRHRLSAPCTISHLAPVQINS
jgi:hypothetical protein